MNELATSVNSSPAVLDGLAQEAQYYATSFTNSILQLGRVFCEAKQLVEHGKWMDWVKDNTGFSTRTAQQFMQAYKRFGSNEKARQIGDRSKLVKLLSLPAGTEDDFLENNDVSNMSTREVDEAVRRVRAEKQAQPEQPAQEPEADQEQQPEPEAEPELPEEVQKELTRLNGEVNRLTTTVNDAVTRANELQTANTKLKGEIDEQNKMMGEAQVEREKLEAKLLAAQKQIAEGNAERGPVNEFTVDVFETAVREFISTCFRMPSMHHVFAKMTNADKNRYNAHLRTIEKWAADSREALNAIACEEVDIL